ncbi:uncharacterized protein LACBIDRAFT_329249 [Laccaria bicolor S238N-H82]|uniref:Predicted protein n=1 Tax=Laccaria bicolor (strain S238N-H82 / ATCC MYA-4686) TaxID=486041 RepID=B0DHH8_LACBS|nr:uncharacterized protein LACBIDRAFT_329249 [Laccaria bicolor S238N-H82]EDR06024.1 predicted protein [Laccaria bicolor S238N-H82]|eukprot:XP_001883312.1 predicted protein [Laccaria bicolor S238N-H82]
MDRPLAANDEHTTSGDGPKRERRTAAARITSSVSGDQPVSSTNREHSIPSITTFMARHAQQPANSTQAEISPPVLPIIALSIPPATSSSTIGEKDVADVDGNEEEPRPHPFTGPSLPADIEPQRSVTLDGPRGASTRQPRSGIDWIVPVDEKTFRQKAIRERLDPTLITAISERDKCALNAKMAGCSLSPSFLASITAIATTVLGGLSTIVASYLARARGSNEPELSIARVKDLEQFIRECEAFKMDNGHVYGDKFDSALEDFRALFEELLGNANGAPSLVSITIPLKGHDAIKAFSDFLTRSGVTLKHLYIIDYVPREEALLWKIFDTLPNLSHLEIDEPNQLDPKSGFPQPWLPSRRFFNYFSTPNTTSGGLPLPHLTSVLYRARWNAGLRSDDAVRLQEFSLLLTNSPGWVTKLEQSLVVKELRKEGMRLVFKFVEPQEQMKLDERPR